MKKINLLIIALLIILVFAGCSSINDSQKNIINENNINTNALRFIVMSDCQGEDGGINSEAIVKTLEQIKKLSPQPSFAVIPGDIIDGAGSYSEEKAQLLNFKSTVSKFYPIEFFYPGFGNHEAYADMEGEQAFLEAFPNIDANFLEGYNHTVYYFDKNNTRFYMLNSDHPDEISMISDKQLDWIKANTDAEIMNNIYFFHEPAYPTGAHFGSAQDTNKLQRDKLWEVIDSSKNPIVFNGHEHNYSRRHIDSDFNETIDGHIFQFNKSVYQIVVGTFGGPGDATYTDEKNVDISPIAGYHFTVVDINEGDIHVTAYDLDGNIIDSFDNAE